MKQPWVSYWVIDAEGDALSGIGSGFRVVEVQEVLKGRGTGQYVFAVRVRAPHLPEAKINVPAKIWDDIRKTQVIPGMSLGDILKELRA